MARGDALWIKRPAIIVDGNLGLTSVSRKSSFREFIWNTISSERNRISVTSIKKSTGWTDYDGLNTLYTLPNGRHVLYNDNPDKGTYSLFYEHADDCCADRFKEWYFSRKAAGKPVTLAEKQQMMKQQAVRTFHPFISASSDLTGISDGDDDINL